MEKGRSTVLEGIRGFCILWVIACHVTDIFLFLFFISYFNYSNKELVTDDTIYSLVTSFWPKITIALGYQVDIFLLISSFLFFSSLLAQTPAKDHQNNSLRKELWQIYLKRVMRLWPLLFLTILWTIWMKDHNSQNYVKLLTLFFFPIDPTIPITFSVCWSVGVDIVNTLFFYIFYRICLVKSGFLAFLQRTMQSDVVLGHRYQLTFGIILFTVSILPRVVLFQSFPSLSYLQLITSEDIRTHLVAPLINEEKFQYYTSTLFPEFSSNTTLFQFPGDNPNFINILTYEYIVFFQRWTPFALGLLLALLHYYRTQEEGSSLAQKKKQQPKMSFLSSLFHSLLFLIALYFTAQPVFMGWQSQSHAMKRGRDLSGFQNTRIRNCFLSNITEIASNTTSSSPSPLCIALPAIRNATTSTELSPNKEISTISSWFPIHAMIWTNDRLFSIFHRPFFLTGVAYLLNRMLLPDYHPLHWRLGVWFFKWTGFQVLGKYSYGIYLFHTRCALQVMMKSLPVFYWYRVLKEDYELENWMQPASVLFFMYCIYLLLTTGYALFWSWLCMEWIEQPWQKKVIQPWLKRYERSSTSETSPSEIKEK